MMNEASPGAFALFAEDLEEVFADWVGRDLELEAPEFAQHRDLMKSINDVRARLKKLMPRATHTSGDYRGSVVKYDRGRGLGVARLDTGEFVRFYLTAYMGRRGSRFPHRGTRVRVAFTEHQGQGVVLAVREDDGG